MAHRQCKGKRRTHTDLALHPNPAPMQLDKLPAEGQPQPGALHLLVRGPHLPELLEHRLLILWGDANPGVAHGDLHVPSFWSAATSIRPPSGVNLMAFDNRFRTTCRTFRSSA